MADYEITGKIKYNGASARLKEAAMQLEAAEEHIKFLQVELDNALLLIQSLERKLLAESDIGDY